MNNTLQNGFRVLEYLSSTASEHSVTELTEVFELPKSHICRLLKTLSDTGYVEQNPVTRKYKVCLRILCLANACLTKLKVRERVKPYIHRLHETLNTSVFLAAPMQGEALIVDAIYPQGRETETSLVIGCINGPYDSATGKVCASWLNEKEIKELLVRIPPCKRTANTLSEPKEIRKELKKVRREKLAITKSEISEGISAIAAPVFGFGGELVGAIGAIVPEDSSNSEWKRFEEEIREAAIGASFAMGDPDYGEVEQTG